MPAAMGNQPYLRRPPILFACLAALMLLATGCATLKPYNPPPPTIQDQVQVPGFPGVRAWGMNPATP